MKNLTDFEVYKLLDSLTLLDASCLIVGASPNEIRDSADNTNDFDALDRFFLNNQTKAAEHFPLVLKALIRSIELDKIQSSRLSFYNSNAGYGYNANENRTQIINPLTTYIEKPELIEWLKQRGVYPDALFPMEPDNEILNQDHPFYSNKLAMIVDAWQQLKYAELDNQTVKNYLELWIKENSPKYGFENMGDNAISVLAEIVNFEKGGKRVKGSLMEAFDSPEKQHARMSKKRSNEQEFTSSSSNQSTHTDILF